MNYSPLRNAFAKGSGSRDSGPFGAPVRWALAILSGILMVLVFPRPGWFWLGWGALVPLLCVIGTVRPRAAFGYGFLSGAVFFGILLHWVARFGGTALMAAIPWIALALGMALYFGLFGWLTAIALRGRSGAMRVLVPALLWVAIEWARSLFVFGFTWGTLAYSQAPFLPLIQIASITGPYGVSFLLVLVNAAIADWILSAKPGFPRPLLVSILLVALVCAGGFWRIHRESRAPAGRAIRIAIIQGSRLEELNVDWTPQLMRDTVNTYLRLSNDSLREHPDVIVWPETAVPGFLAQDRELLDPIESLACRSRAHLLIGASHAGAGSTLHNSVFLLSPQGRILGRYDKVQLVPFGEFVPWRDRIALFRQWPIRDYDYSPGPGHRPLPLPGAPVGIAICFESIFPQIARASVRNGAELLVIVTNDAWFGRTAAAAQHAQMAVFRAVENHRWLARAATSGISMRIDPVGGVHDATGLFEQRTIVGPVIPLRDRTPYSRTGDLFAILCALAGLALLFRGNRGG